MMPPNGTTGGCSGGIFTQTFRAALVIRSLCRLNRAARSFKTTSMPHTEASDSGAYWGQAHLWLAAMNHNQVVERRRNVQPALSPMATLKQLPALVVLERIPIPVLAIANDGALVFANSAFSEMVGRVREDIVSMKFDEIFHLPLTEESAVSVVQSLANEVVELAHQDGSSVRALMSRSALIRADDDIALATFQDLTEQLWLDER
jgi:PAS domain S-box-containing protein